MFIYVVSLASSILKSGITSDFSLSLQYFLHNLTTLFINPIKGVFDKSFYIFIFCSSFVYTIDRREYCVNFVSVSHSFLFISIRNDGYRIR